MGMMAPAPAAPAAPSAPVGGLDLFGAAPVAAPAAPAVNKVVVCPASAQSGGVQIAAAMTSVGGRISLEMDVSNMGQAPVSALAAQFNKSSFGLTPSNPQIQFPAPIGPGASAPFSLPLVANPQLVDAATPPNLGLQIAIKNMHTASIFYFAMSEASFPMWTVFAADGQLEKQQFINTWKAIDDSLEVNATVSDLPNANIDVITQKLAAHNVFYIARRPVPDKPGQEVVYFSIKTVTAIQFLLELTFKEGVPMCKVCVKTQSQPYAELVKSAVEAIIKKP